MKRLTFALLVAGLAAAGVESCAQPSPRSPRAGDAYEITRDKVTSQKDSNGSTGSSQDQDTLVERVVAVRDGGVELEFDLPKSATAQDRAQNWQFPVRVFRRPGARMQLVNRGELEARVDPWLKSAGLRRESCGRWVFTWNAFHIDCDPASVIPTLEAFDLDPIDVREGAMYRDPKAKAPAPLARKAGGAYAVDMAIDPDAVRRERAETDVVVAGLTGKLLSLDDAFQAHARDTVSGTISTTFELGLDGHVRRLVKVTRLEINRPGGGQETDTNTETLTRRLVSAGR